MKKRLAILMLFTLSTFAFVQTACSQSGDVSTELINAFKKASADGVAVYFNNNVDMAVPQTESLFAKAQAKSVLADFFRKNQVKDFVVVHKGTKENASFVIGNLVTANGSFRVSVFFRKSGNQLLVYQLRIEKTE